MSVGTISNISISAYANPPYISVSFAKPANTTRFLVVLVDTDSGYTAYEQFFSSSDATGNTVTCKVTGLTAGANYVVYVTPYNGSESGVEKQYLNSSTTNIVRMPTASITASTTTTLTAADAIAAGLTNFSIATTSTNSGTVTTSSPTGTTTNEGSSAASPGAGSNTPDPSTVTAGTTTPPPSDYNSPNRVQYTVSGLSLNQTYQIKVRAIVYQQDGTLVHSEYSLPLIINTPASSPGGGNVSSSNLTTDTSLSGGSLSASSTTDPLQSNPGEIDLGTTTPSGTGIIINQTGIGGYYAGTKKFYISSSTGDAYFAGMLEAGSIYMPTQSSPVFSVTTDGVLTAKSGTVGGWVIGTNTLQSTNGYVTLDANQGLISVIGSGGVNSGVYLTANNGSPKLYIGSGNFGTVGTGFYADSEGYFSLGNQLTFTPGSGIATPYQISSTTNGTTSVTVSSSDAINIKNGMAVTGSGINPGTYVVSVLGTTVTLSSAATNSTTKILTYYMDNFSSLNVTGTIKGVINSVQAIPSPSLNTTITSVSVTGGTGNQVATFTTSGHGFLANENIQITGLPTTGNLNTINNGYNNTLITLTVASVPDSVTFTVNLGSVGNVSSSPYAYTGLSATATLQEVTMGLHPAENPSTSYYHTAGTGFRLDPYNWWFLNNQFRVGNALSYFKYDGTAFQIKGGSSNYISLNVGGSNAQNIIGITSNTTTTNGVSTPLPQYNSSTTPVYMDANGKFSLGTSLYFDGSNLTVTGNITANSLTANAYVNSPTLYYNKTGFSDTSNSGYYIGGSATEYGINIGSSSKYLQYDSAAGNLNIVGGNITASSFTSTNYASGSGWAITSSNGGDIISANVSGSNVGQLEIVNGGILMSSGESLLLMSTDGGISLGNSDNSISFSGNYISLSYPTENVYGFSGSLRNIWISPDAPNSGSGSQGDVWLSY